MFHTPDEGKRVGLVSLSFERYSKWNGEGALPEKDKDTLLHVIDSVHRAGKKTRFWAAPDRKFMADPNETWSGFNWNGQNTTAF